jgi:membrane fusion protein
MSDLFRPEAVEHRSKRLYGSVSIKADPVNTATVSIFVALGVSLTLWATLADFARTELVLGVLTTALPSTKAFASRPGTLQSLEIKEGSVVTKGDRVATVFVDASSGEGEFGSLTGLTALEDQRANMLVKRRLGTADTNQEQSRLTKALALSKQEQTMLEDQVILQKEVEASAQGLFDLLAPVVADGYVTKAEFERRRQSLLQEQQRQLQLRQQLTQNLAQQSEHRVKLTKLKLEEGSRDAELAISLAALDQQRAKLRADVDYAVLAPTSGVVTSLQASIGRSVDAKQPLFTVVQPGQEFEAELYVPTRSAGFIRPGQEVRIMYDAFPVQKYGSFGGHVRSVSSAISMPGELDTPVKLEESVYRVRVTIEAAEKASLRPQLGLQVGMTLQASIVLERQNLWRRLMAPLVSVRGRS